jgi:RNase H-like domain found in reverse transcriptase
MYQIKFYDKTPEEEQQCLSDQGYLPEVGDEVYLIPGVSPGRNTPVITEFLKNEKTHKDSDVQEYIQSEMTMTEKIDKIKREKIVLIKPVAFYSCLFNENQVRMYSSLKKEFLALVLSVQNFRDYVESWPIAYVMSDSQPILWALCCYQRHSVEEKVFQSLQQIFVPNLPFKNMSF